MNSLPLPVLLNAKVPAWPAEKGSPPRIEYVSQSDAMTRDWSFDAHFAAYSVPTIPHRLRKAALEQLPDGVQMVAFVFEVDEHNLDPDSAEYSAWQTTEYIKIDHLERWTTKAGKRHPGFYFYQTRHGHRCVYLLPKPFVIRNEADGDRWRLFYQRCALYLFREFNIKVDTGCSDWTRLYRLPHATRYPKEGPEVCDTTGDPSAIGVWDYVPESVKDDLETAEQMKAEFTAESPAAKNPYAPIVRTLRALLEPTPHKPAPAPTPSYTGGESRRARVALERECEGVASAPKGTRNPTLNVAAVKLGHYVASGELDEGLVVRSLVDAADRCGEIRDYGEAQVRRTIQSGLTAGKRNLPTTPLRQGSASHQRTTEEPPPDWNEDDEIIEAPPEMENESRRPRRRYMNTDYGNAERFAAQHSAVVRYCAPRRKWLVWALKRWAWDETGEVMRLAKKTVRSIYGEAQAETKDDDKRKEISKHAAKSESAERISAMIKLATSEPGIAVMPDELDRDPWKLNVANGTIDLRTGKLLPHDRRDLITKQSPVAYDPEARSPIFEQYLYDATGGDDSLEAFLRRVAGWTLAGVASEKKFGFLYGPPDSSKSTFLDTLASMLGDYAQAADFTTWIEQAYGGGNRGDLVRLAGARLVTSSEVAKGAKFDEALLKRVTGGDPITAAAKYESEITFRPTFTLLLAANDAPKLRDDDEGAWARVLRIPFSHAIPPDRKDPKFRLRLTDPQDAGPAVLAWSVRGCLEWQRDGLGTAPAVEASTEAYRQEMDRLAGFLESWCEFGPYFRVRHKLLRDTYLRWCAEHSVKTPLDARELAKRLRERGAGDGKSHGYEVWTGIRLRPEEATEDARGGDGGRGGDHSQDFFSREKDQKSLGSAPPMSPPVPPPDVAERWNS